MILVPNEVAPGQFARVGLPLVRPTPTRRRPADLDARAGHVRRRNLKRDKRQCHSHLITFYLAVVGTFTASTQAMRGVVRGVGKLIEGQPREALGEVAGGLAAPLKTARASSN